VGRRFHIRQRISPEQFGSEGRHHIGLSLIAMKTIVGDLISEIKIPSVIPFPPGDQLYSEVAVLVTQILRSDPKRPQVPRVTIQDDDVIDAVQSE
jgi:hypothetical protein